MVNTDSVGDATTNVSSKGGNDWGESIGCVACKPGYRPIWETDMTDS